MNERILDVALVRMPYSEIGQPSLSLGLLKAAVERKGLAARVVSANLWFAEEVGPAIHDLVYEAYSSTLVGEYTFASALFPGFQPDDEEYLRKVVRIFRLDSTNDWRHLQARHPYLDYAALIRELRRRAPDFVERTADRVLALNPRIVGCTSTFQQHCASLSLLRAVKQRRPEVVTMIGGANCEGEMGRATFEQFPFVDFVVSGEADGFFGGMCETIVTSGVEAVLPSLPAGVWGPHHRRDRASVSTACEGQVDRAPIVRLEDMNQSPIPNYDDYFAALGETACLGKNLKPALPFQTARGCWWGEKTHCTFCGISKTAMKFRAKSGDNVMEQMLALRDKYGINSFQGTEYIFDYRFFDTLLPRLKELDAIFRFEVKANLKVDQLQAFVDAGVVEVQPGVESLQDDILGLLKKGTTAYLNVMLLKRGRKIGLSIYWNLLHTIPGDKDEWYGEMAQLVPLLHHLQPPTAFAQIHYDRFSPYWRTPSQYGLTLQPAFGYEMVYPFAEDVRRDLAYFHETPRQRAGFLKYDKTQHPGLFQLIPAVHDWKTAFLSQGRPKLSADDRGDHIHFEDTRAVASAREFDLEGLEARVYRLTDQGITPVNLIKKIQAEDPSAPTADQIAAAVERLAARKIVVSLTGRLVGLAIAAPVPLLVAETLRRPRAELNPSWGKLHADRQLDEIRPSIALSCLRLPQEESLTRWLATTARRAEANPPSDRAARA